MSGIETAAVIGFGAIGSPIAHLLQLHLNDGFSLVATGMRRLMLESRNVTINGESFRAHILPDAYHPLSPDLLVSCVKNYDLESSLPDIRSVVGDHTIILPLQNGIYAYDFYRRQFPKNAVLRGFIQGPNTRRRGNAIRYTNPGVVHMGIDSPELRDAAAAVNVLFTAANLRIVMDNDIARAVWRKWMLNVAGNTVTALTMADYSDFRSNPELPRLCTQSMNEFASVANAEGVGIVQDDIDEVINYFMTYEGSKRTSMVEDVIAQRRTENEFLAGELVRRAERHGINVPITRTLYGLMQIREELYLNGRIN